MILNKDTTMRDIGKNGIDDLAVCGGRKLFEKVRPIGQLCLPNRELFFSYSRDVFERRRFTNNGPLVVELEQRLKQLHCTDHCVAFANATIALIVLLKFFAGNRRGKVLMPAFTYPGLPHIARWAGQEPLFCDIDEASHTLDPMEVEKALESDVTAILGVHHVNAPCFIDELQQIADSRNTPLVFDSVHGFLSTYHQKPIGSFGAAEVFSLHATKILNGFEGGYVTTDDGDLAEKLRKARNFSFDSEFHISDLGLNGKLNEIHAAAALACIDDLDGTIERNRQRFEAYVDRFSSLPGLSFVPYQGAQEQHNYEFAILRVGPEWPVSRDQTINILREEGALCRPYYDPPLHWVDAEATGEKALRLPVTEKLSKEFIQMPVGELLSIEDIEDLFGLFVFILENSDKINHYLVPVTEPVG